MNLGLPILTDGVHLVCADLFTLHAFADRMGLRRAWFQPGRHPHYDLTTRTAAFRACENGALLGDCRQVEIVARSAR